MINYTLNKLYIKQGFIHERGNCERIALYFYFLHPEYDFFEEPMFTYFIYTEQKEIIPFIKQNCFLHIGEQFEIFEIKPHKT